jgi:hypothetical protein
MYLNYTVVTAQTIGQASARLLSHTLSLHKGNTVFVEEQYSNVRHKHHTLPEA